MVWSPVCIVTTCRHWVHMRLCAWPSSGSPAASCRRDVSVAEYERLADDFARRRFGSAGQLPQHMVEVRHALM